MDEVKPTFGELGLKPGDKIQESGGTRQYVVTKIDKHGGVWTNQIDQNGKLIEGKDGSFGAQADFNGYERVVPPDSSHTAQ